jgi:hypothetical protein
LLSRRLSHFLFLLLLLLLLLLITVFGLFQKIEISITGPILHHRLSCICLAGRDGWWHLRRESAGSQIDTNNAKIGYTVLMNVQNTSCGSRDRAKGARGDRIIFVQGFVRDDHPEPVGSKGLPYMITHTPASYINSCSRAHTSTFHSQASTEPAVLLLKLWQESVPRNLPAVSSILSIILWLPLTSLVLVIRSRPCSRRSGEIMPHSKRVHLIHSPNISLFNHLFRLQMRIQAAFQAFYLAQKAAIALPYHKLGLLFSLSFKSSFLLRPHKLALWTGMSSARVPQLSPLLL